MKVKEQKQWQKKQQTLHQDDNLYNMIYMKYLNLKNIFGIPDCGLVSFNLHFKYFGWLKRFFKKKKKITHQTMWSVFVSNLRYAATQTDLFQNLQHFPEEKLKLLL